MGSDDCVDVGVLLGLWHPLGLLLVRVMPEEKTDKIRILVKGTNDPEGTVGLMEVEAFGPR